MGKRIGYLLALIMLLASVVGSFWVDTPIVKADATSMEQLILGSYNHASGAYSYPKFMPPSGGSVLHDAYTITQVAGSGWAVYLGAKAGYYRVGEVLYDFPVSTVTSQTWSIRCTGNPTGTLYTRVRSASGDSILGTLGELDVSTMTPGSQIDYVFNSGTAVVSTIQDIRVTAEYTGGDSSNYITFFGATGNVYKGGHYSRFTDSWTDQTGNDFIWSNLTYYTSDGYEQVISSAGALSYLTINAPGSTDAHVVLYKNGTATTLEVALSGDSYGRDSTHSVSVSASDRIALAWVGGTFSSLEWSVKFTSSAPNCALILGKLDSVAATSYGLPNQSYSGETAYASAYGVIPCGGVIEDLYVHYCSQSDDFIASYARTVTLMINGVETDLSVTVAGLSMDNSDTAHQIEVNVGDTIAMKCVVVGGSSISYSPDDPTWGMLFTPDNNGESFITGYGASMTNSYYHELSGQGTYHGIAGWTNWQSTETGEDGCVQTGQFGVTMSLYAQVDSSPGTGKSYQMALRTDSVTTDLSVTISGANTTGNDTSHIVYLEDYDQLALVCYTSGSPSSVRSHWGICIDMGGDVSSTPTVTTLTARNIGVSTANLRGYLNNNGGLECQYRFIYGETISYGSSTEWTGALSTGQSFMDIAVSLTADTEYHFRASAMNDNGVSYGDDETFTTGDALGPPTNFRVTKITSSSLSLAWTKGDYAPYTWINYKAGEYPSDHSDGTNIYDGAESACTVSDLTAGTTYYFRAWGYDLYPASWSIGYAQLFVTTSAEGAPGEGTWPTPTNPNWITTADASKLTGMPGYGIVDDVAAKLDMTTGNMFCIILIMLAAALNVLVYVLSRSVIVAIVVVVFVLLVGLAAGPIPGWIFFIYLVIAIPAGYLLTRGEAL